MQGGRRDGSAANHDAWCRRLHHASHRYHGCCASGRAAASPSRAAARTHHRRQLPHLGVIPRDFIHSIGHKLEHQVQERLVLDGPATDRERGCSAPFESAKAEGTCRLRALPRPGEVSVAAAASPTCSQVAAVVTSGLYPPILSPLVLALVEVVLQLYNVRMFELFHYLELAVLQKTTKASELGEGSEPACWRCVAVAIAAAR